MIKDAIKYLKESFVEPRDRLVEMTDSDGITRSYFVDDEGVAREVRSKINDARANQPLLVNSLSGLVDYIKSNPERNQLDLQQFLHVKSESSVVLKGMLDSEGEREVLVAAEAITPDFNYEYFYDAEELIVGLQSKFVKTNDRDLLLKVIGNVKEENVKKTGDNGFSQAVTIKTGVASNDDVIVPNPVTLAPYRTFIEIKQPISDFIFRMKDGPRGAIFEADGGMWRNQAIRNIADYLENELSSEISDKKIIIIA